MTSRGLLALLVLLVALAGAAAFLLLRGSPEAGSPGPTQAPAPRESEPDEVPAPILPEAVPPTAGPEAAGAATEAAAIDTSGTAASVLGRVLDRSGGAVAQARVLAFAREGDPPFRSRRDLQRQEATGADGRFRFIGLPAGQDLGVEVQHDDYAPEVRESFRVAPAADVDLGDIVLQEGMLLRGIVYGAEAQPIEGATITLSDVAALVGRPDAPAARSTTTDQDGRYAFAHLAARQYALEASADEHAAAALVLTLVLQGGLAEMHQDFHLERADSQLGGWVLGPDDRGVADVSLTLTRTQRVNNTYFLRHGRTGADGRFDFPDVPDGVYQLDLDALDYYLDRPVDVQAGADEQMVRAQAALIVRGVLLASPPPERFHLHVQPDGRSGAGLLGGDRSDQDLAGNRFEMRGLRPGSYRFEVLAPGFALSSSADVIIGPGQGPAEVVVPLQLGGEVKGQLRPAAGGVRAELRESDWDPASPLESTFPTGPVHGLFAVTAPDGSFHLGHVPVASYVLTLRPPGAPPIHVRDVEVREAEVTDVGVLAAEQGGTLFGNVVGADGQQRAGVRVSAAGDRHQAQVVTDAQGAFRLEALPAGDYDVQATPGNLWEALRFAASAHVTLHGGEELGVELQLVERPAEPR